MRNLLVLSAALVLAAGCKPKKNNEASNPPDKGSNGADMTMKGSGSAGSGDMAGSTAPAGDPKLIERGAYLVKASGCLVCHTGMGPTGPDLANAGAGGLEMPDAIGTWRTPNITFDKGTGIGNW